MRKIYISLIVAGIVGINVITSHTFAQIPGPAPVNTNMQISPQMVINDQILNAGGHSTQNDNNTNKTQYSYHKNGTGSTGATNINILSNNKNTKTNKTSITNKTVTTTKTITNKIKPKVKNK